MNWKKEAKKYGRYMRTEKGFRIYKAKEPLQFHAHSLRDLSQEKFIAIDKTGCIFTGSYWNVIADIRAETFRRQLTE